jgi:hypothetical protein
MKRTQNRQKSSFRFRMVLFLAIFLVALAASALHHHNTDGFVHKDCPFCIAANHSPMAHQSGSCDSVAIAVTEMDLPQEPLFYGSVYVTYISSRAPPA